MSNILILNGSPRKNGNTSALVKAFTEGAQSVGHNVTTFFLYDMNIHGCRGCFRGGKDNAHPCVQRDDMELIYPAYLAADVVVLASPLYYWMLSGQLLTAFSRFFAVAECDSHFANPHKDTALLMAATDYDFDEVLRYYKAMCGEIKWNVLGHVLCGGVNDVGDIAGNPKLDDARKLGASIK